MVLVMAGCMAKNADHIVGNTWIKIKYRIIVKNTIRKTLFTSN